MKDIRHNFVSPKPDDPDPTIVRPSNWNDTHDEQIPEALSELTDDATHRIVTDVEKGVWNGKQDALGFTPVPDTREINGYALTADVTLDNNDIGLGNVPNTDCTDPSNIVQNLNYRFVTDIEKGTWNGKQDALGYTPEDEANKITAWGTPDDVEYPSAKLVHDSLSVDDSALDYADRNLREFYAIDETLSIQYDDRQLTNSGEDATLDWEQYMLYDSNGQDSVDWENRYLKDPNGNVGISYGAGICYDGSNTWSLNYQNRLLHDSGAETSLDWENRKLIDEAGDDVAQWSATGLKIFTDVTIDGVLLGSPVHYEELSADTTLTSDAAFQFYECTAGANGIRVTLMASSAATEGREITFVKKDNVTPLITIIPDGTDKIAQISYIFLTYRHNRVTLIDNGAGVYYVKGSLVLDSGWINTSDWTNRAPGTMKIPYDTLVGKFKIGEKVTQGTVANTWNIVADTGSVLTVWNATGTGFATNNYTLTGSQSGATALVNTATTTKNIDYSVYHGFNTSLPNLEVHVYFSVAGAEAGTREIISVSSDGQAGIETYGVDLNNFDIQTGEYRTYLLSGSGVVEPWDTEDYYYKIIVKYNFKGGTG